MKTRHRLSHPSRQVALKDNVATQKQGGTASFIDHRPQTLALRKFIVQCRQPSKSKVSQTTTLIHGTTVGEFSTAHTPLQCNDYIKVMLL